MIVGTAIPVMTNIVLGPTSAAARRSVTSCPTESQVAQGDRAGGGSSFAARAPNSAGRSAKTRRRASGATASTGRSTPWWRSGVFGPVATTVTDARAGPRPRALGVRGSKA